MLRRSPGLVFGLFAFVLLLGYIYVQNNSLRSELLALQQHLSSGAFAGGEDVNKVATTVDEFLSLNDQAHRSLVADDENLRSDLSSLVKNLDALSKEVTKQKKALEVRGRYRCKHCGSHWLHSRHSHIEKTKLFIYGFRK